MKPGAPKIHQQKYGGGSSAWEDWGAEPTGTFVADFDFNNLSGRTRVSYGDVDQAFRDAYLVLKDRFETKGTAHEALEPHAAVAHWDASGKLIMNIRSMSVFYRRFILAKIVGVPSRQSEGGQDVGWFVGLAYSLMTLAQCDAKSTRLREQAIALIKRMAVLG